MINVTPRMDNIKGYLAGQLKYFNENVSEKEKVEALHTCQISRPTLERYLSGNPESLAKIDIATCLFEFFAIKVRDRIEYIREIDTKVITEKTNL